MKSSSAEELPRVLVVEDDLVSAAFLRDAARAFPAEVRVAGSLAEARRAIQASPFDLWLVDAHLPDGPGELLLGAPGASVGVPALAHTAATESAVRERLLSAGFRDVLCKPLCVGDLHAALRRYLCRAGVEEPRLPWDDAAALRALGGEAAHVVALRTLFREELPGQRERLHAAARAGDEAAMRAELHRLAASCGFVGAAGVATAVRELQACLLHPPALRRLDAAIDAVLCRQVP